MDKHALDPACLLGDRLQTLSRAELTALAEALCRILAERGTYHGGIRPDNISRAADGTVGLGAPARTDTKDWTTEELEFMAPEVFWSGTRDASADVYSLGLLLYAGVSGGRLPFYPDDRAAQPEDQAAALRRRMNGEPLPPARKAGRGLKEIIARATQCKPEDRYAAPAELCAALEADGFHTVAGGAFACRHAFTDALADGRPDWDDKRQMGEFAARIADKVKDLTDIPAPVAVPGDAAAPYYVPKGTDGQPVKFLKAKPQTDLGKCTDCGACARLCPMGAINPSNVAEVPGTCIKCQRCVRKCTKHAKYFDDPAFLSHVAMLEQNFTEPKENEVYL